MNSQKSDEKISFGKVNGVEIGTYAGSKYYYLKNEGGSEFIEYSIVVGDIGNENVHLMAFPYMRVLKNADPDGNPNAEFPSTQYNEYYYTYQKPEGMYKLSDLNDKVGD